MQFDAYAGSIKGPTLEAVAETIALNLGATVDRGNARRRYGQVLDIEVDGRQAAWCGFDRGNDSIYFEGKGETSPDLVRVVRQHFPEHTVARGDVAEDFDQPGAFERLIGIVRGAKGDRVYGGFAKLSDDPDDGRTWEAGKRGGLAYLRVYEKGKQREMQHHGRPHWARLELECRPHYARDKKAAATMGPLEFWGFASWSHRVAERVAQIEVPRFEPERRTYETDRTSTYLARTFRRHFEELIARYQGDMAGPMLEFARVWAEDDAVAASLLARPN